MHPTEEQAQLICRLREMVEQAGPPETEADPVLIKAYMATLDQLLDAGWTDPLDDTALLKAIDAYGFHEIDWHRRYHLTIWRPPVEPPILLRERVKGYDAMLMDVEDRGQQQWRARVVRCYGKRFAPPSGHPVEVIEFTGSAGVFGNRTLVDGERAIVFIRWSGRGYCQPHMQGHLSVRRFDGSDFAILLGDCTGDGPAGCWGPAALRAAATFRATGPGPTGTFLPFDLVEEHLLEEIALASRAASP